MTRPTKAKGWTRRGLARIAVAVALAVAPVLSSGASVAAPPAATTTATLVVVADSAASKQAVEGLAAKLPAPWKIGDDAAVRRALAASGQRAPGQALGTPAGRAALGKKAHAAASDSGAQAVLFVRVTPKKGKR